MELEKFFASPADPCFGRILNNLDTQISDDLLEDWMFHLRNQSRMSPGDRKWKSTLPFLAIADSVVQLIFLISEKLEQPNEVRFLTVELFDRFMMHHFTTLHESVFNKPNSKQDEKLWAKVVSRVQNQALLRLMSCMQLASKLVAHYQVLSPKRVRQFLTEAGHSFTTSSIMSSEIRVYKTLDFKLPLNTPFSYLETLLAILLKDSEKWNCEYDGCIFQPLYKTCMKILEIAFMMHKEIYCHLFWMVTGRKGPIGEYRNQFLCVECDNLLLAAGVISCATHMELIQKEKDLPERILNHLSLITAIPKKDIAEFALTLTKVILGHNLPS